MEGGKQCVKWVGWKRKWQHEPSTLEWLRIKDGVCLEIINMIIIIKTDTDSSCGFCGRFALLPLNYTFVLARMSLRDFFLFANRRQVLLACISKVWDLIRREGWEWRNSLNLCESPDEFFSCLRISRRLWKYGPKNQKHILHKDSNLSKQQKNELIKISMPAACSRVFIRCTLIK